MATVLQASAQENPITAGTTRTLLPQPCILVIFGGDGDLAWRKLLPAVYNLNVDGVLPSHFAVVCFGLPSTEAGTKAADPDAYLRDRARDGIQHFSRQPLDAGHWEDFARSLFFVPSNFDDDGKMTSSRVGYYEGVGALRDMVQNHMLQVLCIAAMEPPHSLEPDVVRDAKVNVLHCLRPMRPGTIKENVVRAQYIEGYEHGRRVKGYRHEVRQYFEEFVKKPIPPESV